MSRTPAAESKLACNLSDMLIMLEGKQHQSVNTLVKSRFRDSEGLKGQVISFPPCADGIKISFRAHIVCIVI